MKLPDCMALYRGSCMKLEELQVKLAAKKEKDAAIKGKYNDLKKEKALTVSQRLSRIEELLGITDD